MRKKIRKIQLNMLWPNHDTNGTQHNGAHAQQQNTQRPRSPRLAAQHPARARLAVSGIRPRRQRILLSREPAQPKRTASLPHRPNTVAERHGTDSNPQRDMANDAEALPAELPARRNLDSQFVSIANSKGGVAAIGIWCNTPKKKKRTQIFWQQR